MEPGELAADHRKQIVSIDLMMPIHNPTPKRALITRLQLKHIESMYTELKEKGVDLSLTFVGPPRDKDLMSKLMAFNPKNSYVVFSQAKWGIDYKVNFDRNPAMKRMLHKKIQLGLQHSVSKSTDLVAFHGSNDFIVSHFFLRLKQAYFENLGKPVIWGIPHRTDTTTAVCFAKLELSGSKARVKPAARWSGQYDAPSLRSRYCGGVIGFSANLMGRVLRLTDLWNEIQIEKELYGRATMLVCEDSFYINMKSDVDITRLEDIQRWNSLVRAFPSDTSQPDIKNVLGFVDYLNKLLLTIT
jgi:hypothetical protein